MTAGRPRWLVVALALFATFVLVPLMHVALPNALSQLRPRAGWIGRRPGVGNWLGLIPVIVGVALFLQAVVYHLRAIPSRVELKPTANYLVRRGPYRFTRNPMYLAGVLAWLGWAVFYGSWPVLIGAALWAAVTNCLVIPREERALAQVFGEAYQAYLESTRRWL